MKEVEFYRIVIENKTNKNEPKYREESRIVFPHKSIFVMTNFMVAEVGHKIFIEITIWSLIFNSIIYSFKYIYWYGLFLLRKLGFLNTPSGEMISLKHFTFMFWKYKIKNNG